MNHLGNALGIRYLRTGPNIRRAFRAVEPPGSINPPRQSLRAKVMPRLVKEPVEASDLDAEATVALEEARNMQPGPAGTEALKKADILRKAADLHRLSFAKRGRPRR